MSLGFDGVCWSCLSVGPEFLRNGSQGLRDPSAVAPIAKRGAPDYELRPSPFVTSAGSRQRQATLLSNYATMDQAAHHKTALLSHCMDLIPRLFHR